MSVERGLNNVMVHKMIVNMQKLYSTTAHATGDGRNGHVSSDDGIVDLDVRMPKELGGSGDATNPEQLFAAGHADCFHSALHLVAQSAGVELDVSLPHATAEQAQQDVEQAHQVRPYSNATRNNIDVGLSVV